MAGAQGVRALGCGGSCPRTPPASVPGAKGRSVPMTGAPPSQPSARRSPRLPLPQITRPTVPQDRAHRNSNHHQRSRPNNQPQPASPAPARVSHKAPPSRRRWPRPLSLSFTTSPSLPPPRLTSTHPLSVHPNSTSRWCLPSCRLWRSAVSPLSLSSRAGAGVWLGDRLPNRPPLLGLTSPHLGSTKGRARQRPAS